MKQRLIADDLLELTDYQKERLGSLWQPQLYDVVLATICTDVENDEYQYTEFVIGDIAVHRNYHGCTIFLRDLKSMPQVNPDEESLSDEPEEETIPEEETDTEAVLEDDDFVEPADEFDVYIKEHCLPLLNIGQVIELLQRLSYGEEYFELTIPVVEEQNYILGRDGCRGDFENVELCDLLWECLKMKL